ncbi:MAG: hypothetical protein ACFFEY_14470 [Candidatus Thorarchaeota archaeon]
MAKGGAVLGIIGLLLGAGALGFGFIIWMNQNALQLQISRGGPQETLYLKYDDIFDIDTINTYLQIPNLSLSIDLTTQTSIYLLFTCLAYTTGNPISRSDIYFHFYMDGYIISYPAARVGTFKGNYSSYYHSVSLQHMVEGLAVGTHNFSVYVRSTVDTNSVQYSRLLVQSYLD